MRDHQAGAQRVDARPPPFAGDGDDHVAGLDRRGEPEVGFWPAVRGCAQLCPRLPDLPSGIGRPIGLDDQHAGLGQAEPKVVHVAPGVDLPGDRARPWAGGLEGDGRSRGCAVTVSVAATTPASTATPTTAATPRRHYPRRRRRVLPPSLSFTATPAALYIG